VTLEGRIQRDAQGNAVSLHCFLIDITKHKQIEEALLHAKEAAEAADRSKSMFIASMSHELRTPLNSIIGFTGILLQGISGELNAEQRSQLERVYSSGKHLLALICDVIDISKIEAGFLDVNNESFDLRIIIDEAVAAVRAHAHAKNLNLDARTPPELIMYTDRKRLLQCIPNLLNNAVKYTERGQVGISACETEHGVEVTVTDTGIGIESEAFARLFQPFERLD
jgi:signal transduction histidine kinase